MILDATKNIRAYAPLLNKLEEGLAAIEKLGDHPAPGRYEFDGGFFLVQEGDTTPMESAPFEAHRRFVDVQIICEGCEELSWAYLPQTEVVTPYNEEKDNLFSKGSYAVHTLVPAGTFYVAFPQDAHRPSSHTGEASHHYRKIVLKLPV